MCLLFDLSFFVCLVSATLPLCLPYSGFSFLLKPYSPLQMACCIQLGITQADSLIKVASKHSASLSLVLLFWVFFLCCDWRDLPKRDAQHLLSPHLSLLCACSDCHFQFQLRGSTAPMGIFEMCSIFSLDCGKQTVFCCHQRFCVLHIMLYLIGF